MPAEPTVSAFNHPARYLEGPKLLHHLIDWNESRDQCAIDFTFEKERRSYSYAELKSSSDLLSTQLRSAISAREPQTQVNIPIFLPQCPALYVSQIAVLKSGAAFCPINLDTPPDRLKFIVQDVSASVVITTPKLQSFFSWPDGPQLILVDHFPTPEDKQNNAQQDVPTNTSSPAYIMYTSGSSGQPKGVIVSHQAVTQSLLAHQEHIPSFKRFLQFAAPSFDVSVFEIFFPLIRGSTLVGCDRSQLLNDLAGTIVRLNIDAAELTPTVAGSLLQKRASAPCLKLLLTIGEMLTTPIIQEFGGFEDKKSMLYGMYGPTEAAIHCNINPAMSVDSSPRNIGRPLGTVSNFVVAPAQQLANAQQLEFLPRGAIGELLLGGTQLADGYLNRQEQNSAAFVWHEDALYYRTGDQARMLDNGTIELFGRINSGQVKIRGQRVELGEIEEAIYKQPGVKSTSVVVLNGIVIAFVLLHGSDITVDHILETCSKWLPKFMIPVEIIVLREFPYLPSGKVDKRKLQSDYEQAKAANGTQYGDPITDTESCVQKVLTETLGHFNHALRLAAAGVDSLMAIRISAYLRKQGYDVSTLAVLECETYKALVAACIAHRMTSGTQLVLTGLSSEVRNGKSNVSEKTLPCTPLQNALIAETISNAKAYQNWVELEITQSYTYDSIVQSFLQLAHQNPVLRVQLRSSTNYTGFEQFIQSEFPISSVQRFHAFNYDTLTSDDVLDNPVRLQIMSTGTHRLLLFLHHALYDAWSLELLLDDFNNILMSYNPTDRPDIRPFVESSCNGTLTTNLAVSQQYWKDHLGGLVIEKLPTFHHKKSTVHGLALAKHSTNLRTEELFKVAHGFQVSPQSVLQAAYSLLLSAYHGSADVCFGVVFSGRTLPIKDIESLVFPCLSTLPMRIDTKSVSSLKDLVHEIHAINRRHLPHSSIPLRDVKHAAGISPGQQLFDTLFAWQQTLHDLDHERESLRVVDTLDNLEFTITIEVVPTRHNIELRANYQQALVSDSQVAFLLRQLEYIANRIIKDPDLFITDVFKGCPNDLLSAENTLQDMTLSNHTLTSPVEILAEEDGARIAIQFATSIAEHSSNVRSVSYQELNAKSNQIARMLKQRGVTQDELVCICMEKCPDLYLTILAVTKLGAGYLPIVPDTPDERIMHILQEANVRNIVLHSASRAIANSLESYNLIDLDIINLEEVSHKNLACRADKAAAAYCIYTSGSTGTPKGVVVTQGNLLSNLDMLQEIYPTSQTTRLLQSCSQAFDVSVFEIFFTWRIGGCLCSASKDVLFSDLERSIRALQVTHLSLTPTVAALVDPENVPRVEFLVTAGEAVTEKVFTLWAGRGLFQGYGPSETTNICTVNPRVTDVDFINNIGKPFSNTSLFVLQPGPDFKIVPRGGVGEFCFGGSQVFRGYLNPEQNIGTVIEHPKYGRLYRSGDYGRLMPDGSLAFTGRKDDQVKIRGQRVELGEINNVMLRSGHVSDCITMILDSGNDQKNLTCFWTGGHKGSLNELRLLELDTMIMTELFSQLQGALPVYMIPAFLIPVTYLPSTSQGKIDKRLLVSMFKDAKTSFLSLCSSTTSDGDADHEWTGLEQQIVTVLAGTTGVKVELIGPDASFFAFGVDSISAIGLAKNLTITTQRKVEISDVLKNPTVRILAELIAGKSEIRVTGELHKPDIDYGLDTEFVFATTKRFQDAGQRVQKILPCTPLQIAMLSASDISTKSTYRNEVTFNVHGDVKRIQEGWIEMIQRHDILRTSFVNTDMVDHPYVQVVIEAPNDLSLDSEHPPSLSDLPYTLVFDDGDNHTKLKLSMHHALYDGVALDILYHEIEQVYRREPLQPAVEFGPFLEHVSSTESAIDSAHFWTSVLEGVRPSRLQVDQDTPSTDPSISKHQMSMSLKAIEAAMQRHSTTLLAVCHTAWASILAPLVRNFEVCFGNVVGGRTIPVNGVERLVAPCFNTLPIRMSSVHKMTYLESFRSIQNLNADMLPFQFTPLRRLQQKFSPDGGRLFDTLVILQQPGHELDSRIWEIEEDIGMMDFPFVIEFVPKKGQDVLEVLLHSHFSQIAGKTRAQILQELEEKFSSSLENPRRLMISLKEGQKIMEKTAHELPTPSVSDGELTTYEKLTAEEMQIRDVIALFSDVPSDCIRKDTTIFRLGLDSISTVQVATKLRKEGYKLLGSDILENPSIAQLARFLAKQNNDEVPVTSAFDLAAFDKQYREKICTYFDIDVKTIEAVRPCTAVQSGMLAQTLHSGGSDYVNSIWLELDDDITIEGFKHAWRLLVAQHEMLRTGLVQIDNSEHPFAMVTYHNEHFRPVFLEGEDRQYSLASEQLICQPWSIGFEDDGKKIVVQFQAHHAMYDAQSLQHILSDLATICAGHAAPSRPTIGPLLSTVLSQSKLNMQSKQEFWQNEENKIIINRFPDLTPLRVYNTTSGVCQFTSRSTTSYLEQQCKDLGLTMQAVTQVAWAKILAAYTGEITTTFGMTLSGRGATEDAEDVPFPTLVTLPVRCEVAGTNQELLRRTVLANAALHKHQLTPLTLIQKLAGHSEGKILDTLFAYQKTVRNDMSAERPWKIVKEEANIDYALSMEVSPESTGELTLRLTFKRNLIPTEHAELLLSQYDVILNDLLENPLARCDVTPEFGSELLSITPAKQPVLLGPVALLHDFVTRGAQLWADKIALEFATSVEPGKFLSRKWTYQELDQESNRVANLLIKERLSPGELVGICFDKCPEASFAIIGIMKAGCAYVALDPSAPLERLRYIVQDSAASLILSAGTAAGKIDGGLNAKVITLSAKDMLEFPCTPPELGRALEPSMPSYCLYTSGTTGTPKGCLISHDNAVQAMYSFSLLFDGHWNSESKWLQLASFHFDVSVLEQFWSWSVGICMASAPRDLIFEDIPETIRQLGITHIDLTPSLARLVHPIEVPSLINGVFITGGEPLKQEILDAWGKYACIYNGYGPTEATIGCTMYPRVPQNGNPSNIGPAWENAGSYVLKPGTDMPVLRGGVGELCISGKLVGIGYLNRPELTKERFPTLQPFNERVYRTGDLVRILHNGNFIFLGRADDQVKLRGQRLELGEINEVIKKSTKDVDQVVTLVLKHVRQQKEQLVTFFVSEVLRTDESKLEIISSIRTACVSRLPGYMVPTYLIPVEKMPLNANHKADVKQLATHFNEMSIEQLQGLSQAHVANKSWSTNEEKIVRSIARALDMENTSINRSSNIFELGVDSISIIRFARRLQDSGLSNAKLSVLKSNPSMDSLVKALLEDKQNLQGHTGRLITQQNISAFSQKHLARICASFEVESSEIEAVAPCTPVQEGIIYRFLESDSPLYFNEFEFRLEVSVEALWNAWDRATRKVQVLRTKFVETDDGYAQVVFRSKDQLERRECLENVPVDKAAALEEPFQLAMGTRLVGGTMKVRIFHALYDGNSLTMLLRCVVGELQGNIVNYGPRFHSALSYGPLAPVKSARSFWQEHLKTWAPTPLLASLEDTNDVFVSKDILIDGFETLRRALGVSHQAIVQAAWLATLQQLTCSNLTIGIITSGRAIDFDQAECVIGPLFNTLPFHTILKPGMAFTQLIKNCHDTSLKIQDYQHTPLKDIQKWSRAPPGENLFDSLFVFQRPELDDEGFADGVWTVIQDDQVADYPLAFEATLSPDCCSLKLTIVAQGKYVEANMAHSLLSNLEKTLKVVLGNSGVNLIELDALNNSVSVPSGMLPSKSLRAPDGVENTFVWTEKAKTIRQQLSILANIPESVIDERASIFELGLDSIDVIKLSSRLKREGIVLAVSAIIKAQSISRMTRHLENVVNGQNLSNGTSKMSLETISDNLTKTFSDCQDLAGIEAVLPATPIQEAMVSEMIASAYQRYFNVEVFKIENSVKVKKLESALKHVIAESPVLRTTFWQVEDPEIPYTFGQVVHSADSRYATSLVASVNIDIQDSVDQYIENFRSVAVAEAQKHKGLLQIHILHHGVANYFLMAISHALYDGASLLHLHSDIQNAYNGTFVARPHYSRTLAQAIQSATPEAIKFWKATLSDARRTQLPPRRSTAERPAVERLEQRSTCTVGDIEAFCRASKITMQTLGQTCWAIVLGFLAERVDLTFGTVLSCRDTEEADAVMFPLMNTVAVRSVLHGSTKELLAYMQDMSDSIRQYQHFPLSKAQSLALSSTLADSGSGGANLLDTLFIYQGRRSGGKRQMLYTSIRGTSEIEFPVCVEMEVLDGAQLVWTTACKSTVDVEATEVIELLETVLNRLLQSQQEQVLTTTPQGVSILGLEPFQLEVETSVSSEHTSNDKLTTAEWSDTENKVRAALHQLSHIPTEDIHRETTIFHLGLDSILILKLPGILRKHGIKLRVSDIMREQTTARIAKFANNSHTKTQVAGELDIESVIQGALANINIDSITRSSTNAENSVEDIGPLTSGQLFMFRHWRASGGSLFYPAFEFLVEGELDISKFNKAWLLLQQRHPILRTTVREVEGRYVQVVNSQGRDCILDGSSVSTTNCSASLCPPINLVVSETCAKVFGIKLVIQHTLYDGISLPLLLDELQQMYQGKETLQSLSKFREFVAKSYHFAFEPDAKTQWTQYLATCDSLVTKQVLHVDYTHHTEVYTPASKTADLRRRARTNGVSTDALILAAVSRCRARMLQDETVAQEIHYIIIGIYHANRAPFGEDLSTLCAPTLNLLPLIIHKPLQRSFSEVAHGIQNDLHKIGSAAMSSVSLEQIFSWTAKRVDFWVNIVKNAGQIQESGTAKLFKPVGDVEKPRANIATAEVNHELQLQAETVYIVSYPPFFFIILDEEFRMPCSILITLVAIH